MIKRKAISSYTDQYSGEDYSKNAICSNCENEGITVRMVKYEPDPKHYKCCPNCRVITNRRNMRYLSEVKVLGEKKSDTKFEVAETRRGRSLKRESEEFDISEYPIAGKKDTDLEFFSQQGIIVSVEDTEVSSEEEI